MNRPIIPEASALFAAFRPLLAQVQWQSIQDAKGGAGKIAGLIIIVSWVFALVAWFKAAAQRDNNPNSAKEGLTTVWMFAIGGPLVGLLYYIFVGASGTPTPTFD